MERKRMRRCQCWHKLFVTQCKYFVLLLWYAVLCAIYFSVCVAATTAATTATGAAATAQQGATTISFLVLCVRRAAHNGTQSAAPGSGYHTLFALAFMSLLYAYCAH